MKIAIAHLVGESPYSQSKNIDKTEHPPKAKELPDDYEKRTWRQRMHVTKGGHVEIPGPCFAVSLKTAAKRLGIPIPGKRGATYAKYFEAGVMVTDGIVLPVKAEDVPGERLFVPSDGKAGGGKRVYRTFPRIDSWEGEVKYYIFDDIIGADVFKQVLVGSGMLVGIGRFRPENRGFYGRFSVKSIRWLEGEEAIAAE